MSKVIVSLKDIDRMKSEVGAIFAHRHEPLFNLFMKEFTGFLNRKGIKFELEIEEPIVYSDEMEPSNE